MPWLSVRLLRDNSVDGNAFDPNGKYELGDDPTTAKITESNIANDKNAIHRF